MPKYYAPFGEQYNEAQLGVGFPGNTNFATYFHEETTGLNYADQRFYNATYGRFMSADPYKQASKANDSGSWNKYSYVEGDSVNHTDHSGRWMDNPGLDCGPDDYCEPEVPIGFYDPPPPPPPATPQCSVKLEYRQVTLGRNHASIVVSDSYGYTFTIQGAPDNKVPNLTYPRYGFLEVANTAGDIGDQQWGNTLTTANDSMLCNQVSDIERAEDFYSKNRVVYQPLGPNSNSLASWLLSSGYISSYFSAPPRTVGWGTSLYEILP